MSEPKQGRESRGESPARLPTGEYSVIKMGRDRRATVELDPGHPGFRDPEYRARRNAIAQIAEEYKRGQPIPEAPYIEQEHQVWRVVCEHLRPAHEKFACQEYLDHARELDLPTDRIPQLEEVSRKIEKMTGFRLEPVGGLVEPRVFLSTLGDGVFLSTQYIRHHSVPLYTPEPDVVHELIGHAAMLASPAFTSLSRLVGEAAKRTSSDEDLERLGRVYWFSIEFGVIREEGHIKAYGAGLLSSAGELQEMHKAEIRSFDPAAMLTQSYDTTMFQPVLYCGESFASMAAELGDFLKHWKGK